MKNRRFRFFCAFLLTGLLLAACLLTSCVFTDPSENGASSGEKKEISYKIALLPSPGVKIIGSAIRSVGAGEEAVFYVSMQPGMYYLGNSAGAEYDRLGGTLTVPAVSRNLTFSVYTAGYSDAAVLSLSAEGAGDVRLTEGDLTDYNPGTRTVVATPGEGCVFTGWTLDKPLKNGGERVSTDPEYSFRIDSPLSLIANFVPEEHEILHAVTVRTAVPGGTVTWDRVPDTNTVNLSAVPDDDNRFLGWSTKEDDPSAIFSKEAELSYLLTADTEIYPVYLSKSEYLIVYHTGDGTVADTGETEYTVKAKFNEVFACQQTLSNRGQFVRDGYLAVGYTTSPVDFTKYSDVNRMPGFSNMGGICEVPEDRGMLDLWVVWAKAADPSDFAFSGGKITAYRGNETVVVIPEAIENQAITSIAAGAFAGKALTRLVLPRMLNTIEDNAFSGCTYLREVTFFDSILKVTNESFSGCPNIEVVALHSHALARQKNGEGLFCVKYERIRRQPGKRITVLSGSSSWNGFISSQMQETFPDYYVINYGTNMENSESFFLEVISKYTHSGDIVIHAPEITGGNACGGTNVTFKLFRANCQCYDIFRDVDMRRYSNFWTAYGDFVKNCPNATSEFQVDGGAITPHGDMAKLKTGPSNFSIGNVSLTGTPQIVNQKANLNLRNAWIRAKGGTLLQSFGTVDEECVKVSQRTQSVFDAYTQKCSDALDYPVISSVGSYLMKHEEMADSQWHCNATGARVRTERLTNDLKKYFDSLIRA